MGLVRDFGYIVPVYLFANFFHRGELPAKFLGDGGEDGRFFHNASFLGIFYNFDKCF